jgi:hypothetical protein
VGIDTTQDIGYPHSAMSANGNIVAVWSQQSADPQHFYAIWGNRSVAGRWGTPAPIQSGNTGDAGYFVSVATDRDGNAMALWDQTENQGTASERHTVWWNFYSVTNDSWAGAQRLEMEDTSGAGDPQVVYDAHSNAFVAVWGENPDPNVNFDHIRSSRYVSGAWGAHVTIDDDRGGRLARVAVDDNGNVVVAWITESVRAIAANRHTPDKPDQVWGTVQTLRTNGGSFLDDLTLAVDKRGNAFAFWNERPFVQTGSFTGDNVLWSRFTVSGGGANGSWGAAQTMSTNTPLFVFGTPIVFTAQGDAFVLGLQQMGPLDYRNRVNHYTASNNTWDGFAPIGVDEPTPLNTQTLHDLAIDPSGNLLAAWSNDPAIGPSYSTNFAGSGWTPKSILGSGRDGALWWFQTHIDGSGNPALVWAQWADDNRTQSVWSRRYE